MDLAKKCTDKDIDAQSLVLEAIYLKQVLLLFKIYVSVFIKSCNT